MSKRRENGGTLALIVVLAIVIILVAVGFFYFSRLLGGSQEVQQATDSGNLNVAKQVLMRPNLPMSGGDKLKDVPGQPNLTSEFFGCFDPGNPGDQNVANLQYYNKFVGKAFLVGLNAIDENTPKAKANARQEIDLVQGPGGVGEQLTKKLSEADNTEDFFHGLSKSNNTRMLNNDRNQTVRHDENNYKVSYMLQNQKAPSNLYIKKSEIDALVPNGVGNSIIRSNPNSSQDRGDRFYLVGYHKIGLPGVGDIQFVPLRPKEQPHLVGEQQFVAEQTSPLKQGSTSLIPPNAFKSGSLANEGKTTRDITMRSCAIVGVVDSTEGVPNNRHGGIYPPQIPGFLIIDNSQALIDNVTIKNATPPLDKAATALMQGVDVVLDSAGDPHFDGTGSAFQKILNSSPLDPKLGQELVPPVNDITRLEGVKKNLQNGGIFKCTNKNSFPGTPGSDANTPKCMQLVNNIAGANTPTTTNASTNGLMPVEALKIEVINIRGSGSGCEVSKFLGKTIVNGVPTFCGALKAWDPSDVHNNVPFDIPKIRKNSIRNLLIASQGTDFIPQIQQRMSQMAGKQVSDLSVLDLEEVPPGTTRFLIYDAPTQTFKLANKLPPGLETDRFATDLASGKIPDGNPQTKTRNLSGDVLDSQVINVDNDGGYPHPWDCPYTGYNSKDNSVFTKSSGYNNLLGVLEFSNCVDAPSGEWCCPC